MKNKTTLTSADIRRMIPARPRDSHKGMNGHALIVAGSRGMSGAAVLSALGALRAGAGLVTVAIIESERSAITHQIPEALTLPLPETAAGCLAEETWNVLQAYLKKRSIASVALGPGLSVHPAVKHVVSRILQEWEMPMVLDADGLNNMTPNEIGGHPALLITPHPGELARFLNVERGTIERDRAGMAAEVAREIGLVCVLKGYRTVISDGKSTRVNPTGNPAMATGGMGDVLTGIMAGLLAQGMGRFEAACAAAYLHGWAGDLARVADRGLLATEVAGKIPEALRKVGRGSG